MLIFTYKVYMDTMIKSNVAIKKTRRRKYTLVIGTLSLCSFLFMMTAVICWSMKMRMVQRRAGTTVMIQVHQGFGPSGLMNQPRSSRVGYMGHKHSHFNYILNAPGCLYALQQSDEHGYRRNISRESHLKLTGDLQFG